MYKCITLFGILLPVNQQHTHYKLSNEVKARLKKLNLS